VLVWLGGGGGVGLGGGWVGAGFFVWGKTYSFFVATHIPFFSFFATPYSNDLLLIATDFLLPELPFILSPSASAPCVIVFLGTVLISLGYVFGLSPFERGFPHPFFRMFPPSQTTFPPGPFFARSAFLRILEVKGFLFSFFDC